MDLVNVDEKYTEFLRRTADPQVYKKKNCIYLRPYVGKVLNINGFNYFAPLTSHQGGKLLRDFPIKDSLTFMPINKCKHGGINIAKIIPIPPPRIRTLTNPIGLGSDGFNMLPKDYQSLLSEQMEFIDKNENRLAERAEEMYYRKTHRCGLTKERDRKIVNLKRLERYAYEFGKDHLKNRHKDNFDYKVIDTFTLNGGRIDPEDLINLDF